MIAGWVELDALRAAPNLMPPGAGGARHTQGLGCRIDVDGRDADLAVHGDWVVACEGRPRFAPPPLQRQAKEAGPATAWAALLRSRGSAAIGTVAGEFALAAVDIAAGCVLIACDRFAIRPLCYALVGRRFAFGSRADTVAGMTSDEVDPQSIFEYLYFHVVPTPRTIYRQVHRLPPAHRVIAGAGGLDSRPFWQPRFEEREADLDALEQEFRTLLREAVTREAGDQRSACFLSGGTDSSTVTGMLAGAKGRVTAYSIGFDAAGYDEMNFARIAARHYHADHREYYLTPADLVRGIPTVARHYDQPFGNSSALPAYYCCRRAADDGFERLLAGDGGDELFGGNSRYARQRVFEAYHVIPAALRSTLIEPALLGVPIWSRVPVLKKGVSYVDQARLPMPDRSETYNLLQRLGLDQVLAPGFRALIDADAPLRQQRAVYSAVEAGLVNAMLAFDWKYTLADNDLPKVCGTAALAGVEVGFPLLSDELVDFSLRLPESLKVRGLTLRYFFKRALRDFLPVEILRKEKHGFGLPFGPWLLQDSALWALAADSLQELAGRGLVRPAFIDELLRHRVAEVPGYYGSMVWVLMMLEQWLRQRAPSYRVAA